MYRDKEGQKYVVCSGGIMKRLLVVLILTTMLAGCSSKTEEVDTIVKPDVVVEQSPKVVYDPAYLEFAEEYNKVLDYTVPCLRLLSEKDSEIEVGDSKIGGQPDMAVDQDWPFWKGAYHSFLAQVNLTQLPDSELTDLLPETGMLYFFYDSEMRTWGDSKDDIGSYAIIYDDVDISHLETKPYPQKLSENYRYSSVKVNIVEEESFPPYEHDVYYSLSLSDGASDYYYDFVDSFNSEYSRNKLFGYADNIQGDMRLSCVLRDNDLDWDDYRDVSESESQVYEKKQDEWILLYQQDSYEEMMWGDVGMLYFWIKKEDLINRDFDKVYFELQCY